jgi:hypothetical protein
MGKITGFMEYQRRRGRRTSERVKHYREFVLHLSDQTQARARAAWIAAFRSA